METIKTPAVRYSLFPIEHHRIYDQYKKAVSTFWTPEEIDFSKDRVDFNKCTKDEQHFLKTVLAFFAASDGLVNENLGVHFHNAFDIQEVRAFYCMQMTIETIHNETYSLLIEALINSQEEKLRLFNSIFEIPVVKKKADWIYSWIVKKDSPSLCHQILAFVLVEGLFFASSFAAIYFFKQRGLMPGLCFANDLIARDETLHYKFGIILFHDLLKGHEKVDVKTVHKLFEEAVNLEKEFVQDALKADLIGLNQKTMIKYVEYMADRILDQLLFPPLYKVTACPLPFMTTISLQAKENFFERKVSQYNKVVTQNGNGNELTFDEEDITDFY